MDLLYENIANSIDKTNVKLDQYTEAVIQSINALEEMEIVRSSYFTEETEYMEGVIKQNSNEGIIAKIKNSVEKIFSVENSLLEDDAIKKKLDSQIKEIDSIDAIISKMKAGGVDPSMLKIQLPNIWEYYEYATNVMREHVEKFSVKNSYTIFGKVIGKKGKVIDILSKNFEDMTKALKSYDYKNPRKMDKISRNTEKSKLRKFGEGTVMVLSALNFGILGILADVTLLRKFFRTCPTRIKNENTSLMDIRNKLTVLHPDKYELYIKSILMSAKSSITSSQSIEDFANTEKGATAAVDVSNKINKLISSYTKFYLALVDFYINICSNSLRMFSLD